MSIYKIRSSQFIFEACLLSIIFTLPYFIHINSVLIIILGLNWLFSGDLVTKLKKFINNKLALLFVALYFCYVFAILHSENINLGLKILEIKLSLLVFPLILSSYSINDKLLNKCLLTFLITTFFAVSISLISILYNFFIFNSGKDFSIDIFYREGFTLFLKIHPTYLSIYIFFSILIILFYAYRYWERTSFYLKALAVALVVYFIIVGLLLSARMPLLSFFTIILSFLFYYLIHKKRFIETVAVIIAVLIFSIALLNIPTINKRFVEISETPLKPPVGMDHNSTNIRIAILLCTKEIISSNWLWGVGTGDMQKSLNDCYKASEFSSELYEGGGGYDPHNQYFEVWIRAGIIGLIILLACLIFPLMQAYKTRDILYISFLLLIFLCCITESLLNAQKGVVFYSLFNTIFVLHMQQKKENHLMS